MEIPGTGTKLSWKFRGQARNYLERENQIAYSIHMARIVIPNNPHHVTQRGNRKQTDFFKDRDYEEYLSL